MAENLAFIIVALALLLCFIIFLLANYSPQSKPSEMDKELKKQESR